MDETGDDQGAQINRLTVAQFRQSAVDVLKRAKEGEQTVVEDANGKPRMVIGTNGRPAIIVESTHPEEFEDLPNRQVDANCWLR